MSGVWFENDFFHRVLEIFMITVFFDICKESGACISSQDYLHVFFRGYGWFLRFLKVICSSETDLCSVGLRYS